MTYYGPDETPSTIFLERTFLAGDFLSGVSPITNTLAGLI
jgi:hypothetical protein